MTLLSQFPNRLLSSSRKLMVAGALGVALMSAPTALAQSGTEIDPDAVVATVNDVTITEADLAYAAEDLAEDLAQVPPQAHRAYLVSVLIDMKLMSAAARDANLDETPEFSRRADYLLEQALRRAYFVSIINEAVTDEDIQAAYDEFVAANPPGDEVWARHILVNSEDEALALIEELNAGRDFAELAQEKSTGPTGPSGGDLGYFRRGQMVQVFEDAAFGLEIGAISAPVQSEFGWHVIKLEDRRPAAPPSLAQLAPQIRQQLLVAEFESSIADLRDEATIDILDETVAMMLAGPAEEDGDASN